MKNVSAYLKAFSFPACFDNAATFSGADAHASFPPAYHYLVRSFVPSSACLPTSLYKLRNLKYWCMVQRYLSVMHSAVGLPERQTRIRYSKGAMTAVLSGEVTLGTGDPSPGTSRSPRIEITFKLRELISLRLLPEPGGFMAF